MARVIEASAHNGNGDELKRLRNQQLVCVLFIFISLAWLILDVWCLALIAFFWSCLTIVISFLIPIVLLCSCRYILNGLEDRVGVLRSGIGGEMVVSDALSHLSNEYLVVNNVPLEVDGHKTEIDSMVISKFGIWIFEVKNYSGYLSGNVEDSSWGRLKVSDRGNSYMDSVRSPLKQMHRQVWILKKYLSKVGVNVRVCGYVVLPNVDGIDIDSSEVIVNKEVLLGVIEDSRRVCLDKDMVYRVLNGLVC